MKKNGSFGTRSTAKKQPEAKSTPLSRSTGKVGSGTAGSAAFNRRSPVVTDATIATSSVIQAAADPKIKELVMKQQQIFERESMDKRTPRNRESANALFHSLDPAYSASTHHSTHPSMFWKQPSFGDDANGNPHADNYPETPERAHGKGFGTISPEMYQHQQQQQHYLYHPTTPGSNVDTVVHPDTSAMHDDDGVSSELTADAGNAI